jgi:hypothetical protein
MGCSLQSNHIREPSTSKLPRSVFDIAKNVFQVHGIDLAEKVVVRKQLRRSQLLAFFKALAAHETAHERSSPAMALPIGN